MVNVVVVLPVQVGECLHARAQHPRLLAAAWLIAAVILRTLPVGMEDLKNAVHSSMFNIALM